MDVGFSAIVKRMYALLTSVTFWMLTVICNSVVVISAYAIYHIEHPNNPQVGHFIDALWWSFSTITTVGYGDITPETVTGKVLGMFLMVGGTGLFATYTALFANAMLGREFIRIKKSVHDIKENVADIHEDIHQEEVNLERQVRLLNITLTKIQKRLDRIDRED